MKNITITPQLLDKWNACQDGKAWGLSVIGEGMALTDLLPKFERADWMLWTLCKADACTKVQYVELAAICAKFVLSIYEEKYPKDNRPRKAIEAAIKYAKNPTEANRKAAYAASTAAYTAATSAAYGDAAAYAAYAAYGTAASAASAAYGDAAAYAADAAVASAYDAADAADATSSQAWKKHPKKMCGLMLKFIGGWDK